MRCGRSVWNGKGRDLLGECVCVCDVPNEEVQMASNSTLADRSTLSEQKTNEFGARVARGRGEHV